MTKKYTIKLTQEERTQLEATAKGRQGKRPIAAWKVTRAKALLKIDQGECGPGWKDRDIASALDISARSLLNWKKKAVAEGPLSMLERKPRVTPPVAPKVDGRVEAQIVKLACSSPPEGRSKWTLRLLAKQVVELEIVDAISHETIRQTLKKTLSNPGRRKCGAYRPSSMGSSWRAWNSLWTSIVGPMIRCARWYAWMSNQYN